MLIVGKSLTKKQESKLALAEASKEMAKPRMTESAREQTKIAAGALVVQHHAHQGTVDVHAPAVVSDEPQIPKAV